MQKLSAFSFGTLLVFSGMAVSAPAEAARLQFEFTTQSGGAGSFILDTDTAAVPESELPPFFTIREGNQAYLGAVSAFSFTQTPEALCPLHRPISEMFISTPWVR